MGLLRTIFYCLRLRSHDKKPPERIAEIQAQNLRRLVRFAKERSPFYAELYRGVDPEAPGFSIRDLPPVTKEALMENFDRVVTDPRLRQAEIQEWIRDRQQVGRFYRRRFVVTHTSGTTGTPGTFVYDKREWDWIQAFAVTRGVRYKPTFFGFFAHAFRILLRRIRVALVSVLSGHFVTYVLFLLSPRIGGLVSRFSFLSVVEPLEVLVQKLNRFRPDVLHCYPTMLEVLAYEQMEGRLNIAPWVISCSSEPLTGSARKVIEGAFPHTQLYETYGTSEGVTIASECARHRGLHVNTDYYILESVREDGSPTSPGEPSDRLYLTCLFSRTMPLIRYELNDVAVWLPERCECGLPFPLLKVRGRSDDTFWVYDADKNPVALPPIPFEAVFLDVEGLTQYQLIQEERDLLVVLFKPRLDADIARVAEELKRRLGAYLEQRGLAGCLRVQVKPVEQIQRHPASGKIRQIYSKVERLYLPGRPLGERRAGEDRRLVELPGPSEERRQRSRRAEDQKTE